MAPLLCFEDGGVMELPRARINPDRNGFFQEPSAAPAARQTRHNDICGTIDELKKRIAEEPQTAASDPEPLLQLLDDMIYMMNRIRRRRERYEEFEAAVGQALDQALAIRPPDIDAAIAKAEQIRGVMTQQPQSLAGQVEQLHALAEEFRKAANEAEQTLYPHRDIAREIGRLYREIRGARHWDSGRPEP